MYLKGHSGICFAAHGSVLSHVLAKEAAMLTYYFEMTLMIISVMS
jgi:hypothetical protein